MSAEASDVIEINKEVEEESSADLVGEAAPSDLAVLTADLQRLQAE